VTKTNDRFENALTALATLTDSQALLIKALREDYVRMEPRQLAELIVSKIMSNGDGRAASRLVLELPSGNNGGGWCRAALIDTVEDTIRQAIS